MGLGFRTSDQLGTHDEFIVLGLLRKEHLYKGPRTGQENDTLRTLYFPAPTFYKQQVARCTMPSHTTFFPTLRLRVPKPRPWQRMVSYLPLVPPLGPTQLPPLKPTSIRVLAPSPVTCKELAASCPSRPNSSPRLHPTSASLSRQENLSPFPSYISKNIAYV